MPTLIIERRYLLWRRLPAGPTTKRQNAHNPPSLVPKSGQRPEQVDVIPIPKRTTRSETLKKRKMEEFIFGNGRG